ncbi:MULTISPECIES: hypothetical protein [unclassified Burkholderia]|uniref:hypothetical protein n=1 Tax=unclassified Burkholderia TaxID=2613784 RepID=UPI00163AD344|nr:MULTISPECIES: hypothetical protein [unclassified Burkholderia]
MNHRLNLALNLGVILTPMTAMHLLHNPLIASHGIKRDDASIAQTDTRRGGVYGDHFSQDAFCRVAAYALHASFLDPAIRRAAQGLSIVGGFNAIHQINKKQIGVRELHARWNTALLPVLDALHSTVRFVVAKHLSELGGAPQGINECRIGMKFMVFNHGSIKRHV